MVERSLSDPVVLVPEQQAVPLEEIASQPGERRSTGVDQLDMVLSGGFVPGSVTLIGGEPGIGKSTLLLQAAGALGASGSTVLYVSAEESMQQVRQRSLRLGVGSDRVFITEATDVGAISAEIDGLRPEVVLVDSVQTIHDANTSGPAGSVSQVRECAHILVREARRTGTAVVLAGHVTKDGGIAGPRVLEHAVDTVLTFEGDRHHGLRFLRVVKHRFGSTRALGVFEMCGSGLTEVTDPSQMFLADRSPGVDGSVVVPIVDGNRPLLVELQALVVTSPLENPRRVSQGFDARRLSLLLAVLDRHAEVDLKGHDVYVSVVGGVRIADPGLDLAVALALVSSFNGVAVPSGMVACGEIGLGGEVRQVSDIARRLSEADRMGFVTVVVPARSPAVPTRMKLLRAATISEALERTGLRSAEHPSRR